MNCAEHIIILNSLINSSSNHAGRCYHAKATTERKSSPTSSSFPQWIFQVPRLEYVYGTVYHMNPHLVPINKQEKTTNILRSIACDVAWPIINQHIPLFYTTKLHLEIALYNTLSIDLDSHCSQQQEESQDLDILFQISLGWSIAVLRRQQAPKTYGLVEIEDSGTWSLPGRNPKICFRTGIEGRFYSRTKSNNKIQTHC